MAFPPGSSLALLMEGPVGPGRLLWIGLRPGRREAVRPVEEVLAVAGRGLSGDRYGSAGGARQVTLVAAEHLAAIGGFLGRGAVPAEQLRRNLVVAGVNLLALKRRRFRLGGAVLEWSGECHPCSRMEEVLGPGGYNATLGHGGITARVVEGGVIRVGDRVERV